MLKLREILGDGLSYSGANLKSNLAPVWLHLARRVKISGQILNLGRISGHVII